MPKKTSKISRGDTLRIQLQLPSQTDLEGCLKLGRQREMRLLWLIADAKDPNVKEEYEEELARLRAALKQAEEEPVVKKSSGWGIVIWLFLFSALLAGGFFGVMYFGGEVFRANGEQKEVWQLKVKMESLIENRRWDEVEELLGQLESEGADEEVLQDYRASLEGGRIEERGQQIAFLVSNAKSALESDRLSDAERYCQAVERLGEAHPELAGIRTQIQERKRKVRIRMIVDGINAAIESGEWRTAQNQLESLRTADPANPLLGSYESAVEQGELEMVKRRAEANELVAQARLLDEGTYSAEAIALLEKAVRLDPSETNRDLYRKMSSYGRVVKVPEDYPTIEAALRVAKPKDRVFVAKGTYRESLAIPNGVSLVGESRKDTVIECAAGRGPVVSVSAEAKKVRIASLTLRHSGLVNDAERFPILAIDGTGVQAEDLLIARASGHGVAVLNGGVAEISLSKVAESGWDGISVTGAGSAAKLTEVTCENNLHHGVDFWEGASGLITRSLFIGNGLNGVFAIAPQRPIVVKSSRSEKNREVGFYFSKVVGLQLSDCDAKGNFLGGVLCDQASRDVVLSGNRITENGEAGLVLEKGVQVDVEEGNLIERNNGRQIWRDAVFPKLSGEETVSPPPPPPPLKDE